MAINWNLTPRNYILKIWLWACMPVTALLDEMETGRSLGFAGLATCSVRGHDSTEYSKEWWSRTPEALIWPLHALKHSYTHVHIDDNYKHQTSSSAWDEIEFALCLTCYNLMTLTFHRGPWENYGQCTSWDSLVSCKTKRQQPKKKNLKSGSKKEILLEEFKDVLTLGTSIPRSFNKHLNLTFLHISVGCLQLASFPLRLPNIWCLFPKCSSKSSESPLYLGSDTMVDQQPESHLCPCWLE